MSRMLIAESFDGQELPVFEVDGKPNWIAKQVGAALGYAGDGRELPQSITQKWSDEFVEGDDFILLRGKELRDFKELCSLGGGSPLSPNTPHLMLLTEEGVYNCAILSRKPAGRRLRKWLKTEVLPQIARSGKYLAKPSADIDLLRLESSERIEMKRLEIQRIEAETASKKVDIDHSRNERLCRKQESDAYRIVGKSMFENGDISKSDLSKYQIHAAELLVGGRIERLHARDGSGPWKRARDLAREWKVSEQKVGRAAVALSLRGNIKGMVREVVCRREHSSGSSTTHEYSRKAQAKIKGYIFDRQANIQGVG